MCNPLSFNDMHNYRIAANHPLLVIRNHSNKERFYLYPIEIQSVTKFHNPPE